VSNDLSNNLSNNQSNNQGFDYPNPARTKVAHLVMGVIFLGITVVWALAEAGTVDWNGSRYAAPVILLLAGAVGLAASLAGSRQRPGRDSRIEQPGQRDDTDGVDDGEGTEDTAVLPERIAPEEDR
jgi:hypothetical protein